MSKRRRCSVLKQLALCALSLLACLLLSTDLLQRLSHLIAELVYRPIVVPDLAIYRNVCFEPADYQPEVRLDFASRNVIYREPQKIVVYDAEVKFTGRRKIQVAAPVSTDWKQWNIEFKPNTPFPSTHRVLKDAAAYFTSLTLPGNVYHFWVELFLPIYSVVERTGRLHPGARNYLFYRQAYHLAPAHVFDLYNMTRFDELLDTLYMARNRTVFWLAPQNVCFPTAVFGGAFQGNVRDGADHVVRWIRAADGSRSSSKVENYVTIVRRETRKILNIDELAKATEMAGWRVQVLTFERMKVMNQLRAVVDSCVLVGVAGAALQWSVLMAANRSSLIEFAWPSLYWPFYYHHVTNYSVHYRTMPIEPHNVFVNWTTYERAVRLGKTVDETERHQMLKSPPKEVHLDSIWKWADFHVNITAFLDVLKQCKC